MSDGLLYSIIIILVMFIVSICGANMERNIMRKQAIEHNAAFYDIYTAAFTWRENDD